MNCKNNFTVVERSPNGGCASLAGVSLFRRSATIFPFWLRQQKFKVTKTLEALLADLPTDEAQNLAYIQNAVLTHSKSNPHLFTNLGAKLFNDRIGNDYRRFVDQLVALGQLEVNERYLKTSKTIEGFTKSYRVPAAALVDGMVNVDFGVKKLRKVSDRSTASGAFADYIKKCYSKLTVRSTASDKLMENVSPEIAAGLQKIASGAVNLTKGKSVDRLYHSLIMMPSAGRVFVKHTDGVQLVEGDMKCCHPVLLAKYAEGAEKRAYGAFLAQGDIYTTVRDAMGESGRSRDTVKEDFMRFYNGAIKNYVYRYFVEHFPQLTARILAEGKNMAILLQNDEARVMTQLVAAECIKTGLFYVPMHDGWLGVRNEAKAVARIIALATKQLCGIVPTITTKSLHATSVKEIVDLSDLCANFSNNYSLYSPFPLSPNSSYPQLRKSYNSNASVVTSDFDADDYISAPEEPYQRPKPPRMGIFARLAGLSALSTEYAN